MSLKISHPCVQAEKVLTQQPSCCINCTMNFQVSTSKGRIINHDLSKILKTKHPSQSKQCILAGLEREWRSVSKQILNCFSLLHWHWAGGHAMMVSLDTISQQQKKSSPLSTSATWGVWSISQAPELLWEGVCKPCEHTGVPLLGPGVGCQAGGLPQLPCQLRLLHPLLLSYSILDQCKIK